MPTPIEESHSSLEERKGREESRRNTIRSIIRSLSPFRLNTLTLKNNRIRPKKKKDYFSLPPDCENSIKSSPESVRHHRSLSVPKVTHRPPRIPVSSRSTAEGDSISGEALAKPPVSRTKSAPSGRETLYRHNVLSLPLSEEDLTCPICLELLYRPRQLSCGHTFCVLCLQNCVNSFCGKFVCPSCRSGVTIPSNGVFNLPRNTALENAVSKFRRQKDQAPPKCSKCSAEVELSNCNHCARRFCFLCGDDHQKQVEVDVDRELQKMKEYLKVTMASLPTMKEAELNRLNNLEDQIKEAVRSQIHSLELKGEELQDKVRDIREKRKERINNLSQDIDLIYERIKIFKEKNQNWKELGKMYSDFHSLSSAALLKEPAFVFNTKELSLITQAPRKSGTAKRSKSSAALSSPALKPSKRRPDSDDHEALYRNKGNFCKQTLSHRMCIRPAGVAVSPWDGKVYISGSDSCKIFICDKFGKRIRSFGSRGHEDGEFLCPTAMAFSTVSRELFITDKWKHCIHVFDCDGNFIRRIGMKGRSHGKFCSPEGICTDNNGRLYVADTCNYRVQVLDNDGVFLRNIGTSSNSTIHQSVFTEPSGVAVTPDGSKVYVADCGSHRIKVFNGHTGDFLFMFGSRGEHRGEFDSPESITLDGKGFVLVGDSGNGRIQIFKPNGNFVGCLGSRNNDSKGDIGWVSGIAVNSNQDVFVTEFKNNIISVY